MKKTALGMSPGKDGSISSETKHDRRMAPRPKLFVSAGTLKEQRPPKNGSGLESRLEWFL
jgi:hypothetical protein